jgi:tetraacyldisaccharide 4'-kinase
VRGIAGALERSWSGSPGHAAWTKALLPLAGAYAAASARARSSARAARRPLDGCHVIAIGNLTVGGTGKSTIARWLALEAVRAGAYPAILLRGHGAEALDPGVLPDFAAYPLEDRMARYGDEAIALRRALPHEAVVGVGPDRYRVGRTARDGYGTRVLILDDGWEQRTLAWDELWVALDPVRPAGNGSLLPAGPLRRPVASLREADRAIFLLEEDERIPETTRDWLARTAPGLPTLRLRRTLVGVAPLRRAEPRGPVTPLTPGTPVAVLSGVGTPARLERFLRAAGVDLRLHEAFPDHARWTTDELTAALRRAERAGARMVLITEKDEPRWPAALTTGLPLRVLRTGALALDPVREALRPLQESVAAPAGIV